jgi:hypothetical protein
LEKERELREETEVTDPEAVEAEAEEAVTEVTVETEEEAEASVVEAVVEIEETEVKDTLLVNPPKVVRPKLKNECPPIDFTHTYNSQNVNPQLLIIYMSVIIVIVMVVQY